jgi:alpha-N-arabinofuranosidase
MIIQNINKRTALLFCILLLLSITTQAREYHVSVKGDDTNKGTADSPFKTISKAADAAQPGDFITVHEGTYRERINPPRGGTSDQKRIIYHANPGEKVVIKGSEVIKGWQKVQNDTWKVVIPNSFFGAFNPYSDLIHGDWFNPKGRQHHTGAVYLNDHWLTEASKMEDVLQPIGQASSSYTPGGGGTLLNVAWLQPGEGADRAERVEANSFAAQQGIQKAPCSEGGECIGWIEQGDWVRYEKIDMGQNSSQIEIRAASATQGGIIEIRLDAPSGELLGTCTIPNTGGWQAWSSFKAKIKPTSGIRTLCLAFREPRSQDTQNLRLWFTQVNDSNTTIWAQFKNVNPNEAEVEINVRQAVFYPNQTGINFIIVRGLTMMHAATNWAPPTAEQIGLIGTNWSKGWIIENNDISYSTCVGITLGKHGDKWDNTSENTAEGYVKTIERGTERGWSKENIGHHIVRSNHISHCEQAGIVGSMGAVFSSITDNVIHDIHVRQLFTGAEMAGIKIHAAIDTEIARNHIYRTCRGIWLDWMAQGARVTRNLFHDNNTCEDLFVEVDHGPFLVDNNIFLSNRSLLDMSEGGAYVHNLFAGRIVQRPELGRETPFHPPHSTKVAGLQKIQGGDDRFYNNIFTKDGLNVYDTATLPIQVEGNVYYNSAKPYNKETNNNIVKAQFDPEIKLIKKGGNMYLQITLDYSYRALDNPYVTTSLLGKAKIPDAAYENPDGTPLKVDTDYFGKKRNEADPSAGPFENPGEGKLTLKVW